MGMNVVHILYEGPSPLQVIPSQKSCKGLEKNNCFLELNRTGFKSYFQTVLRKQVLSLLWGWTEEMTQIKHNAWNLLNAIITITSIIQIKNRLQVARYQRSQNQWVNGRGQGLKPVLFLPSTVLYWVPLLSTMLGAEDIAEKKAVKYSVLMRLIFWWGRQTPKLYTDKMKGAWTRAGCPNPHGF